MPNDSSEKSGGPREGPKTGRPSRKELSELPHVCLVAYAARCALRVIPILGRTGSLESIWGAEAHKHSEAMVRAVQAALAACTARTEIPNAAAEAANAAVVAANAAGNFANAAGDFPNAAVANTANAAAAAAIAAANYPDSVAFAHAAAYTDTDTDADADARNDFIELRNLNLEKKVDGRVSVEFFVRPLWADERMARLADSWMERWTTALLDAGLMWAMEAYPRWSRGDFNPEELASNLNAWTEVRTRSGRRPPTSSVPALAPPIPTSPKTALEPTPPPTVIPPPNPAAPAPSVAPASSSERPNEPAVRPEPGVEANFGNDGCQGPDALNRKGLAKILAEFLRDPRTQTPLTLSVEGRWGGGKTKFMGMLRTELDPQAAAAEEKPDPAKEPPKRKWVRTVWFNPWRHQSHENLWAAFALAVLNQMREQLPWHRRQCRDMRLAWQCMDHAKFWASAAKLLVGLLGFVGVLVVVWAFTDAGIKPDKLLPWLRENLFVAGNAGVSRGLVGTLAALGTAAVWTWKKFGKHLPTKLELHLKRPDYAARTSFLEDFHADFARAVKIYMQGERLYVFIDDLDRCDVPRAAELMQGINLMLGDDIPLVYVLGMDRAKVAAGIAVKHKDLLPFLYAREMAGMTKDTEAAAAALRGHGLEYGYEFIEKFIQLPFRLPPSGDAELREFLLSRLTAPKKAKEDGAKERQGVAKGQADATKGAAQGAGVGAGSGTVPAPGADPDGVQGGKGTTPPETGPITPPDAGAGAGATAAKGTAHEPPKDESKGGVGGARSDKEAAAEIDERLLLEPLLHVSRVLEGNPRRIAQLINLVRLQQRLAPALGVQVTDANAATGAQWRVTHGQLAKWTAVALRWPVFLVELERSQRLLRDLVDGKLTNSTEKGAEYERWEKDKALVSFLRDKGRSGDDETYNLSASGVVEALLRLGVAVPVAETAVASRTGPEKQPEVAAAVEKPEATTEVKAGATPVGGAVPRVQA